jgi:hypothetical protein
LQSDLQFRTVSRQRLLPEKNRAQETRTPLSWRSTSDHGTRPQAHANQELAAAYRGLSNGAPEVEIGMAEIVSGNATGNFDPNWFRKSCYGAVMSGRAVCTLLTLVGSALCWRPLLIEPNLDLAW